MNTYSNTVHRTQPGNAFPYNEAVSLLGGRSEREVPCPLCKHLHPQNSERACCGLKLSDEYPGSIVFCCQRCGEEGRIRPDDYTRAVDPEEQRRKLEEAERKKKRKLVSNMERIANIISRSAGFRGSPAEAYLRNRGLMVPDGLEVELHYDSLHHFHTDKIDIWKPALILPMRYVYAPKKVVGMQRIALDVGVSPELTRSHKIDGATLKLNMGTCGGRSAVMIGWPWSGDLAVCEGFETALGVLQLGLWDGAIWAMTGSRHMQSMPLLPEVKRLKIFADHDREDKNGRRPGSDDALVLRNRYLDGGRKAEAVMPQEEGADYADMAAGKCGWREYRLLNKGERDV